MKRSLLSLALVAVSAGLVACGGSSGGSTESTSTAPAAEGGTAGAPSSVAVEADPNGALEFTSDHLSAKAGKVTVDFTNASGIPHNVAIEDSAGKRVGETAITAKGSESTVVNLKAGTYKFFCTIPGHREAGMEGTLTVK